MKIKVDKIASSTKNIPIPSTVEISDKILAKDGYLLVVKSLGEKSVYDKLELVDGRMSKILKGDIIVGVLGERKALKGFKGEVPKQIKVGDTINILNLGGILGNCTSKNLNYGEPLKAEVLGAVVNSGNPISISKNAIQWQNYMGKVAPIILISGTCMNSGKTTAACEIIHYLKDKGYKVAAAKLTGVSCLKDVNKMLDYGAYDAKIFTDAGLPSTTHVNKVVVAAKGILTELDKEVPDYIVVELGDGLLGGYGVDAILNDKEIINSVKMHVICANDPVAAFGAKHVFEKKGLRIDIITGPTTDNEVGVEYVESQLNIPAANAMFDAIKLQNIVFEVLNNEQN